MSAVRSQTVGIIGSGAAGIITAFTLIEDGFENIQILTRDKSPGGVWARERIYPGLVINNVHGEFRFSKLPMPPPADARQAGGRLSGEDMCNYLESFSDRYLKGKFRFNTEIVNIKREAPSQWLVKVQDRRTGQEKTLNYSRIILCTGGCSAPYIPPNLTPRKALQANFKGLVYHSNQFGVEFDMIMTKIQEALGPHNKEAASAAIVIVGGGKSAQDISACLASKGGKVTVVFEKTDAALAVTSPLPPFIRRSRFLGILAGHSDLRTPLERFLHTTWLGSKIVKLIWKAIASSSLDALKLPQNSPLRNTHSMFWGIRVNDEGVPRPTGFHALVNSGKIKVVSPVRVEGYGEDGCSLILNNGRALRADVVILATGYTSSWEGLFDEKTFREIGIGRHPPQNNTSDQWNYTTLSNPPKSHPDGDQWASSIYRGIVPVNNVNQRDFAINGAIFTTNNGYFFEVVSHWISSYFLNDKMQLPKTPEEALEITKRNAAWLRKRFPDMLLWTNESYSSNLAFWTWPQVADELLDDMNLRGMRSGGNFLNWPFKVIDISEISYLKQEREANRKL